MGAARSHGAKSRHALGTAARTVATAAAPELALPAQAIASVAETALGAIRAGKKAPGPHRGPENVPTAEFERPLLELEPGRVRVRKVGGVRVLVVQQPRGLTAKEALAAAALGGVAYASYKVSKAVQADIQSVTHPKLPWPLSLIPGA